MRLLRSSRLYLSTDASCVGPLTVSMGLYLLFPTAFTPFTFAFDAATAGLLTAYSDGLLLSLLFMEPKGL